MESKNGFIVSIQSGNQKQQEVSVYGDETLMMTSIREAIVKYAHENVPVCIVVSICSIH